ncbi:MAG: TolC family protein [Candidatus Eremiobacteraeota bacterium]|nr:TolC family protein [Candidatus Eremiobacteraeota bacterium]
MKKAILIAGAALALGCFPALANAAPTPKPPTPPPFPTASGSPLPYPAYGTPAPGIAQGVPVAGVPQRITLGQAVNIAVARSPVLAAARGSEAVAGAQVDLARVPALPNLSGTAAITRSNSQAGSFGGGAGGGVRAGGSFTQNSLTANLRQLIFDGGRVAAQIRSAQENQQGAVATYRRNLQTLTFNVATAYYNALSAQQATALAADVVVQNQTQENLVLAQIRAGTTARSDLATAQFPTAQARVALVRAQGAELSAFATFANVLGLEANADVRPADDTPANPTASLLQAPLLSYDAANKRALELRPDYNAANHTVISAQDALKAARLGRFPSLTGSASDGATSTNATGGDFRNSNSIGAAIAIPLFDAGQTHAQTAQSQAQLDIANANLQTSRLGIGLSVQQALVNLVSAQSASTQALAELRKAQEVLRATQAQYKAGVTTLPLLLNAQVGLTQAQTDQLNAVYQLRQAEQNYLFALGENDIVDTAHLSF